MTKEIAIVAIENRLKKLRGSIKSPGVIRKLERKIRNLKTLEI